MDEHAELCELKAMERLEIRAEVQGAKIFVDVDAHDIKITLVTETTRQRIVAPPEVLAPLARALLAADSAHTAPRVRGEEGGDNVPRQKPPQWSEIKKKHPRAYEVWSPEEDEQLRREQEEGITVNELAHMHQRQPSAIRSRLKALGMRGEKGNH